MRTNSPALRNFWLKLILGSLIVGTTAGAALAQKAEHYNSPLYSPKTYDPSKSEGNGLPATLKKVGIEQKLNSQLPLDAVFKDENGNQVRLGKYFNKGRPVVLALVYYTCPMLCDQVLNGLTGSLKGINFEAGKDFDVLAISFDPRDNTTVDIAKNKKKKITDRYNRPGTENGWHFLTGEKPEIDKVTKAAGFNYTFDEKTNQFAHVGGIMVVTPEGRMSRYLYGIDYAPKDLKFSLMDSSKNKIGNPVEQLYLYCYHYDPSTGKYGFAILNALRLAGIATLLGLGTMIFVFWRRGKVKSAGN